MDTVDVQLNHFQYRFRKLTYVEEFGLDLKLGEDARKIILATALIEVSGLPIQSLVDSMQILAVPTPVLNRIWILYKTGISEDRFFTTKGLYRSPDPHKLVQMQAQSEETRAEGVDRAVAQMEQRFGKQEVKESMEIEHRLMEDARRRGVTTEATAEKKI